MSTASRAAVILTLLATCAGCHKDFDALFTSGDKTGAASSNGPDEEKAGDPPSGSSGANGTADDEKQAACVCPACAKGATCSFSCPKDCKSCTCDRFTCPPDEDCKVDCGPGTSCDVACVGKSLCTVICNDDAECLCMGDFCAVDCKGASEQCRGDGDRLLGLGCHRACPK